MKIFIYFCGRDARPEFESANIHILRIIMNLADIIILITLIPTVIVGIKKGFISQAISMLTIVIGFWASSLFANAIASWLSEHVSADEQILKIASFAIIFTIVFVILLILGRIVEKAINATFLAWVNKGLGSVLAIINYALVVGVCLIAFGYINTVYNILPDTSLIDNSVMCNIIKDIADAVFPYVSKMLTIL